MIMRPLSAITAIFCKGQDPANSGLSSTHREADTEIPALEFSARLNAPSS